MKVDRVVLRRVRLPLVVPFRTSFGVEVDRDALVVEVEGPASHGWGECVAMTEPLYSSEYVDGAQDVMERHLLPRLALRGPRIVAGEVQGLLRPVKGHRMAKAALEMAVLDGDLRECGRSLASHLGSVRERVPAGVSVGIAASLEGLLSQISGYLDAGYTRVKLKIEPGWDLEPVRAVRERFGPGLALQVDANSAYTLADADHLARLDEYGLALIEQPLGEEDLAGHAALANRVATPICLDESITSAAAAIEAVDMGACSIVNVKAGRVGGYLEARRLHDACAARGVPLWCGGMLETGLGRAANLALAALPGFTVIGDLSASDRYFHRDLTAPFVLEAGHLEVPSLPGIGVEPLCDVLEETTTSIREFRLDG